MLRDSKVDAKGHIKNNQKDSNKMETPNTESKENDKK